METKDPGIEWKTKEVSGTPALQRVLGERSAQYKDDVAKWKKDHPGVEPGVSFKKNTWKSYSKVRYPSAGYREGFDQINWNSNGDSGN